MPKQPDRKIVIELSLDHADQIRIAENSIERVFNTAIRIIEKSRHEDSGMSLEDLQELKQLNTLLWNAARDALFKSKL